jgi:predicted RNase H-like HicB family nuclease
MNKIFTSTIVKEKNMYIATCLELGVVSQGKNVEKAQENLQEAVELYLEDFKQKKMASPFIFVSKFEVK